LAIVLPGAGVTEGGDGPLAKPSARVALDAITALDTERLYVYGSRGAVATALANQHGAIACRYATSKSSRRVLFETSERPRR
jgi:hypothetical protein